MHGLAPRTMPLVRSTPLRCAMPPGRGLTRLLHDRPTSSVTGPDGVSENPAPSSTAEASGIAGSVGIAKEPPCDAEPDCDGRQPHRTFAKELRVRPRL